MNGKVCSLCGSFEHFAKDCPMNRRQSNQSRRMSMVEAVVSTLVGLVVSMVATALVCQLHNIPMTWENNVIITAWMTFLSILRSYLLRRFFNSRIVCSGGS